MFLTQRLFDLINQSELDSGDLRDDLVHLTQMLVHLLSKLELATGTDEIMTAIKGLEVLVARDVVIQEADSQLERHSKCTQRHGLDLSGRQRGSHLGDKALGKGTEAIHIQANLGQIGFILCGGIGGKTDRITKIVCDQTRHNGIQIDDGLGFARILIEQDVIDLGVVVGNTQGELLRVDQLVETNGKGLECFDLLDLLLNLIDTAAGVLVDMAHQHSDTATGIVEIGDGLVKGAGIEIGKQGLEIAECLTCGAELIQILAGVIGHGVGNEFGNAPEALILHVIVLTFDGVGKVHDIVTALPFHLQLIRDMGGDRLDVLHDLFRVLEHENVQLLEHIAADLALVLDGDIIGGIDVTVADDIDRSNGTRKAENACKLGEFLFHCYDSLSDLF